MEIVIASREKYIRFAKSIVASSEEAEDIVHECYARLLEHRSLATVANQEAYLMQMVRNASLDFLRKQRPEELEEYHMENMVHLHHPERLMEGKETLTRLEKMMSMLGEKQRTVFYLRDIAGYELGEIENILGMTNDTVRANLSRARKQLKELYGKTI